MSEHHSQAHGVVGGRHVAWKGGAHGAVAAQPLCHGARDQAAARIQHQHLQAVLVALQ